jgi:hypothetical protein
MRAATLIHTHLLAISFIHSRIPNIAQCVANRDAPKRKNANGNEMC